MARCNENRSRENVAARDYPRRSSFEKIRTSRYRPHVQTRGSLRRSGAVAIFAAWCREASFGQKSLNIQGVGNDYSGEGCNGICAWLLFAWNNFDKCGDARRSSNSKAKCIRVSNASTAARHVWISSKPTSAAALLLLPPHNPAVARAWRGAVRTERINGNDNVRHQKAVLRPAAPKRIGVKRSIRVSVPVSDVKLSGAHGHARHHCKRHEKRNPDRGFHRIKLSTHCCFMSAYRT